MSSAPRSVTVSVACKACGTAILWATWHTGKKCPVDELEVPDGDLVLSVDKAAQVLRVAKYDATAHAGRRRFVAHFATCPKVAEFRRGR